MFVCYIDSSRSTVPHMEPLDANNWREAVAEAGGALKQHDRASAAAVFSGDVLVAIVDRAEAPPVEPLPISRHPIFASMPAEVQIAVGRYGVLRSASSGDPVPPANEVMFVISGALAALVSPTGPAVEVIGPGTVRGLELGIEGGQHPTMTALLDSRWIGLSPEHLCKKGRPDWLIHLYAHQAPGRQRAATREIACYANHTLDRRAPELLLRLQSATGGKSTIAIRQTLLATALGVVRTSLSATAARLQADGLIRVRRCCVSIPDAAALRERACGCWSDPADQPSGERTPRR
jgi:CRP-like cAMP-binding protein